MGDEIRAVITLVNLELFFPLYGCLNLVFRHDILHAYAKPGKAQIKF